MAEVSDVRVAALCAVTAAVPRMQENDLLHILYDEDAGNFKTTLKQIVSADPDQECRNIAQNVAQNMASALEAMGPALLPAS